MGIRFWKRVRLGPLLTLNFGLRGVSISFGPRGAHLTLGKQGYRTTLGLPGTGLFWSKYKPYQRWGVQRERTERLERFSRHKS